ncbi:MAG: glycogen/starch synthase [Chthoniobacterales bacterium]
MNIFMATSEMEPFARTGSFADVMLALPGELQRLGHQVSVAIPFYRCIRENKNFKIKSTKVQLTVAMGNQTRTAEVFETRAPNGVQVLLIRRDEYFDRSGLYGTDGADYQDNAERFIFFTKCVIELAKRLDPVPEILHAHDWQTALLPLLVKAQNAPFATALTIHNLAYQGNFWSYDFALTNLGGEWFSVKGAEFYGSMNCIKAGIVQADAVIVPSAHYARDIQTKDFGCGLEDVIQENAGKIHGIPDGVDYSIWNPASDSFLSEKYEPAKLKGKAACRAALLKKFDLDPSPSGPIFTILSRLIESKGIDILLPILDRMLAADVRLIIVGEGNARYETVLKTLLKKHRRKMAWEKTYEESLAHLLLAGGDMLLLPARLEASGVTAMAALKYGTLPLARATGGLHQIVRDYDSAAGTGNGFVFYDYTPEAFLDAVRRAGKVFSDKAQWQSLMSRAMEADFSWVNSAKRHERIYETIAKPAGK